MLSGAKYWILFPPSVPNPPGVFVSASGAEITAPVSIGEYLLSFHHHAVQYPGCIQAVCRAGEIMHVPAGWLHMVVNLEEGVAVTQNFVPRARLPQVLRFLRDKPDQISGFANDVSDPWRLFVQRLQERRPDVLTDLDPDLLQRSAERRPRWRDIAESGHGNGNGNERGDGQNGGLGGTDSFTFGFCDDGDD